MISNDRIENYFFLRKKMFRINKTVSGLNKTVLQKWDKATFFDDCPKEKIKEVIVYENPKELPEEMLLPYISFLESKVYKSNDLMFTKD
ncbi:hypothetical protein [Brumimicrobium aurantiacum]|uniref:Uncharacterized protein n=1 Tax=Brumimicrobium aurantiacum TaxID=1737063 RepID=A0A3E1EZE7_9FLAO|nr:hypothetical protein [Brumimicrobium aurantiacum]RFC54940.1 hypothetical protein DXU93_03725 [Brumimicrobium aurantiacum]